MRSYGDLRAAARVDTLLVFGSNGRVYSIAGGTAARRPRRRPADHHADRPRERHAAAHYFAGAATQMLLLAGTGGFGLLARAGDLVSRQRGGKAFLALGGGREAAASVHAHRGHEPGSPA